MRRRRRGCWRGGRIGRRRKDEWELPDEVSVVWCGGCGVGADGLDRQVTVREGPAVLEPGLEERMQTLAPPFGSVSAGRRGMDL